MPPSVRIHGFSEVMGFGYSRIGGLKKDARGVKGIRGMGGIKILELIL